MRNPWNEIPATTKDNLAVSTPSSTSFSRHRHPFQHTGFFVTVASAKPIHSLLCVLTDQRFPLREPQIQIDLSHYLGLPKV